MHASAHTRSRKTSSIAKLGIVKSASRLLAKTSLLSLLFLILAPLGKVPPSLISTWIATLFPSNSQFWKVQVREKVQKEKAFPREVLRLVSASFQKHLARQLSMKAKMSSLKCRKQIKASLKSRISRNRRGRRWYLSRTRKSSQVVR